MQQKQFYKGHSQRKMSTSRNTKVLNKQPNFISQGTTKRRTAEVQS